jgi:hypothetical protein
MIRKLITFFLIITLVVTSNVLVFASDSEGDVHIISPEVGESGKTILNDALFISIYVQSDDTLFLSLKKEMPKFTFEEKDDILPLIPLMPTVTSQTEVKEEKVSLGEIVVEAPMTKEEIVAAFEAIKSDLEIIERTYVSAKSAVSKIPNLLDESAENYNPTYQLTEKDKEVKKYFEDVEAFYQEMSLKYEIMKAKYDALFEKDVFDQQEITVDPEFPYFEYNVSNIEPGNYKLQITDMNGKIIEMIEFEVVTEQVIAEKILETNNIFDQVMDSNVFE